MRQLETLEREIKDSMVELDKIHPFYEEQVKQEKEITKGYVWHLVDTFSSLSMPTYQKSMPTF